jgi:hypothetical protein
MTSPGKEQVSASTSHPAAAAARPAEASPASDKYQSQVDKSGRAIHNGNPHRVAFLQQADRHSYCEPGTGTPARKGGRQANSQSSRSERARHMLKAAGSGTERLQIDSITRRMPAT